MPLCCVAEFGLRLASMQRLQNGAFLIKILLEQVKFLSGRYNMKVQPGILENPKKFKVFPQYDKQGKREQLILTHKI